MNLKISRQQAMAAVYALALTSIGSLCAAQETSPSSGGTAASSGSAASGSGSAQSGSREAADATQQVNESVKVVRQMESDPQLRKLLQQAKGVFIVPNYSRAGLGVGGSGGEGVLLVNNKGKWSNPVFYNIGGMSVGAQVGVEVGSMAMLLMNDKAVNNFMQNNKFSLTADAGLTIANYESKAQGTAGRGDVIVWSDTKGALVNATVGVTDITFDEEDNRAFYKSSTVAAKDIIGGKVKSAQATPLTQELSSGR